MKKTHRRIWSILLGLVMLLGLFPGMTMTAYATSTETLLTTITATGTEQASYSTANVATVSFSNLPDNGSSYVAIWGWWGYGWTATVTPADGYTITKCVFYDDKDRTATDSEAPFVVETTEDDKTPKVNGTPILADMSKGIKKIEVYGYATPAHIHSFTYSASGATITATCSGEGDCDLTNKQATLTIAAEGGTYDGATAYGATVTNNIPAVTGDTVGDIAYFKVDTEGATTGGTAQAGAPTGVGYYYAGVTLTSGSNTYTAVKAFTVAKANSTATAPTNLTATYGQTLANITLTNPQGNTAGTWSWVSPTASVGDAGTKTFKANFTPTDTANYNTVSNVDVSVTVSAAAPTATAPTNLTATYGQTLANITLTNPQGNTAGTWSWVSPTTSVGAVGTKTFKANFTPTDTVNYNTVSNVDVSVTVSAAAPTATAPTNLTATYGQTLADITLTNPDGNTEGAWAWQDEGTTPVGDVGAHTYKATFTPTSANYNTVQNVDVSVTVNPAPATITTAPVAEDDLVYNTLSKPLVKAGAATGGTMMYAVGDTQPDATAFSAEIPQRTDEQSYTVWYYAKSNSDNYTDSAPASLTVTLVAVKKDILDGGNQTIKKPVELKNIRIDGEPDKLLFVKLDNRELVKDQEYTIQNGSTIVILPDDVLRSLAYGRHTLFAQFTDGYAETTFTIRTDSSPVLGTNEKPLLWLGLMLMASLGMLGVLIANRKRFGVR